MKLLSRLFAASILPFGIGTAVAQTLSDKLPLVTSSGELTIDGLKKYKVKDLNKAARTQLGDGQNKFTSLQDISGNGTLKRYYVQDLIKKEREGILGSKLVLTSPRPTESNKPLPLPHWGINWVPAPPDPDSAGGYPPPPVELQNIRYRSSEGKQKKCADASRSWAKSDEAMKSFLENCTSADLPNNPAFDEIKRNAGVLLVLGEAPKSAVTLCSGTYLSNNLVLTAKHCFFDAKTGGPLEYWGSLTAGRIVFKTEAFTSKLGCNNSDIESGAISCNAKIDDSYPLGKDYVFLSVKSRPSFKGASFTRSSSVVKNEDLFLYGAFPSANNLLGLPSTKLRFSSTPGCRVKEVKAQCVQHNCQAEEGTSGAGLFVKRQDKWMLYAVHVGAQEPTCSNQAAPNNGVIPIWGAML